jgi:hypothetical protein
MLPSFRQWFQCPDSQVELIMSLSLHVDLHWLECRILCHEYYVMTCFSMTIIIANIAIHNSGHRTVGNVTAMKIMLKHCMSLNEKYTYIFECRILCHEYYVMTCFSMTIIIAKIAIHNSQDRTVGNVTAMKIMLKHCMSLNKKYTYILFAFIFGTFLLAMIKWMIKHKTKTASLTVRT